MQRADRFGDLGPRSAARDAHPDLPGPRGWHEHPGAPVRHEDPVPAAVAAWGKVRLTGQKLDVIIGPSTARFNGSYELEARADVGGIIFAIPLGRKLPPVSLSAKCDGQALTPMPHTLAPVAGFSPPDQPADEHRGQELHRRFDQYISAPTAGGGWLWYAYDLPAMTAGQKRVVSIEAVLAPRALADTADGPAHAFEFPLRIGRFWAAPAGRIDASVTLDGAVDPASLKLIRPAAAKREGRRIGLQLDSADPSEDLVLMFQPPPAR